MALTDPSPPRQLELLAGGAVDLVRSDELLRKLETGNPLLVKAGFDPSAPDIHLGHLVVLRKMRQFQELGHHVVFVVGDFTARIGDPSGRSRTRPPLSAEEVRRNAETYMAQATRVLDPERTRLEYNSRWLDELGTQGLIRLASHMTVARMIERDDFQKRFAAGQPIAIHEFLYPLAQAYDSVFLKADVELGGTDQTFNLLVGRDIMREYGLAPQVVLTTPLLVGLDGVEKMSKSLGNYVAIEEAPAEMYGKLMSISDELMWQYFPLLTDLEPSQASALRRQVEEGIAHPMELKLQLAHRIVASLHGAAAADSAQAGFDEVFRRRQDPTDLKEHLLAARPVPLRVAELITLLELAPTLSEARRLIAAGALRLDRLKVTDPRATIDATGDRSYDIKLGKHRFARVRFTS